jgi:ABC-type sugar transport system ATPase subunit
LTGGPDAGGAGPRAAGLELQGLTQHLGGRKVVDGLTLRAEPGELLALVGPSGSGKSSLLRLVAGLADPDAGRVLVAGRDVTALPPDQRDIAMVFQNYALFPHMTVADNLAFGMQARREAAAHIRQRVAEVAQVLGLGPLLQRHPRELSGGERQRVALGRAMLRAPKLFLLDEPLSNLDAQLRVQTRAEIVRLHERLGATMVVVTHDQVEALTLGHRVGVLHAGRLVDIGSPESIYDRPRTLFSARFIGSPPMNTLAVVAAPPGHVLWQQHTLPMPPASARRLGAAGRPLVLGVRPEHVLLQGSRWAPGDVPAHALQGQVQLREFAGDQCFLDLLVQGERLLARVEPGFAAQRGQPVTLWFQPDMLRLFDPGTGLALGAAA